MWEEGAAVWESTAVGPTCASRSNRVVLGGGDGCCPCSSMLIDPRTWDLPWWTRRRPRDQCGSLCNPAQFLKIAPPPATHRSSRHPTLFPRNRSKCVNNKNTTTRSDWRIYDQTRWNRMKRFNSLRRGATRYSPLCQWTSTVAELRINGLQGKSIDLRRIAESAGDSPHSARLLISRQHLRIKT